MTPFDGYVRAQLRKKCENPAPPTPTFQLGTQSAIILCRSRLGDRACASETVTFISEDDPRSMIREARVPMWNSGRLGVSLGFLSPPKICVTLFDLLRTAL